MRSVFSSILAGGVSFWNLLMDNEVNRAVGLILSLVTLMWILMQMIRAIVGFVEHHIIVKDDVVLLKIRRLFKGKKEQPKSTNKKIRQPKSTNTKTNGTQKENRGSGEKLRRAARKA